jgi:hypothetical protein
MHGRPHPRRRRGGYQPGHATTSPSRLYPVGMVESCAGVAVG